MHYLDERSFLENLNSVKNTLLYDMKNEEFTLYKQCNNNHQGWKKGTSAKKMTGKKYNKY